MDTVYLGSSTGLRRRHVQPTGHVGVTGKSADLTRSAWVGAAAGTSPTSTPWPSTPNWSAASAGRSAASTCRGPLPDDPPADRGRRPHDLRLLGRRRAGTPTRPDRLLEARRGTRVGERLSASPVRVYSDPAEPGLECAPFAAASSRRAARPASSTTASPGPHRLDRRRHPRGARPDRHSAGLTGLAVTPASTNLVVADRRRHRVAGGPRRRPRRRAPAHLPLVHPARSTRRPCCSRASPAAASTGSRAARSPRGEQLPFQREPDRPPRPLHRGERHRPLVLPGWGDYFPTATPRCSSPTSTCRASARPSSPRPLGDCFWLRRREVPPRVFVTRTRWGRGSGTGRWCWCRRGATVRQATGTRRTSGGG